MAAFGSGAVFSAVSGMGGPNVLGNALTTGFFFALVQGGLFQVINCTCCARLIIFVTLVRVLVRNNYLVVWFSSSSDCR